MMTLEVLNQQIRDGSIDELIRVAEGRQVKALSHIADDICSRNGVRIVLLAGGSSVGKTTTAKRLCTQLRINDREALLLSLDDYFVGDKLNPRDEKGRLDYEHFDCIDRVRLGMDLRALMQGEPVLQRRFDFVKHCGYDSDVVLRLSKDGIVVIEGLHALNPMLTANIAAEACYRVFIEPQPNIEIVAGVVPTAAQSRFLRRMVRDNHFRKVDPLKTLKMWPSVIAGEAKWITPFKSNADATFDSYLVYELAAIKFYVGGLLEFVHRKRPRERSISDLIRLLAPVEPISPNNIPGDSILRETIGGSQLDY